MRLAHMRGAERAQEMEMRKSRIKKWISGISGVGLVACLGCGGVEAHDAPEPLMANSDQASFHKADDSFRTDVVPVTL